MAERKENVRLTSRQKIRLVTEAAKRNEEKYGEYAIQCESTARDLCYEMFGKRVTTPTVSTFLKKWNKALALKGGRRIGLLSRTYTTGGGESLADLVDEFADMVDEAESELDDVADSIVDDSELETESAS